MAIPHSLLAFMAAAVVAFTPSAPAADPPPLKVLLVSGGGYHDYATQKEILKKGLRARVNVQVDDAYTDDRTTKPPVPIHGRADYAAGYDVVIHDQCAADVSDPAIVQAVLAPHRKGMPAVVLHCAVHSYRIGNPAEVAAAGTERARWFEFLGIQSSGHGSQKPIEVAYVAESPIARGLANWTTGSEELYNNVKVYETVQPVARGRQGADEKILAWTNRYGDARVFCTTLAHNTETVASAQYLDLVARGLLWAAGKLDAGGKPLPGYGPRGNP